MTVSGYTAREATAERPPSVGRMFLDRVDATPDREAYRYPTPDGWSSLTWQETKDRVWGIGAGLISLGVEPEQRVSIAASTRIEWVLADLAINAVGAATTTVYPSTTSDDVSYILGDSQTKVAFAEDEAQVEKILAHRHDLPELLKIVMIDGDLDDISQTDIVITLEDLEKLGAELLSSRLSAVDDALATVTPDTLATLVYTSGTTGRPKGVRLVNDNWTYEAYAIDELRILSEEDVQYLWLPLSHVFGKVLEVIQMKIGFATAVDGDLDRIVDNLSAIKPTFMAGAPRIFEKVRARVITVAEGEGGAKAKIFSWAFGVGAKVSTQRQAGHEPKGVLAAQHKVADKLVFSKVRERMGGRVRFFISGSAKLSTEVAEWFHAAGMLILEGYGLTETAAASCVNLPYDCRFGTVGPPVPGTEVAIADDGEVLLRGPGVMRGYHGLDDATKEVLTDDGWFHTGDIGELADGYVRVTDRKKDLIKTSGGKYVAPQKIEVIFKAVSPHASEIIVHGDTRNFCSALITLDEEAIVEWANHNDLAGTAYPELVTSQQVRALMQGQIDDLNSRLERWETIKRFEILPHALTVEEGEITPSLKVRRKAVEQKYMDILDSMYTG